MTKAKSRYKIPEPLKMSFLDLDVSMSTRKTKIKPYPLKLIMWFGLSISFALYVVFMTFIGKHVVSCILFIVLAIWVILFFGQMTKTREMKFMMVPSAIAFMAKPARHINTRQSAKPGGFYSLVGIHNIVDSGPNRGLIEFADNTFGYAFLVVGSASNLLFEDDRNMILDRVESFWRRVDVDVEFLQITTREPQRIHHQIVALQRRMDRLDVRHPDLMDLLDEQYKLLTDYVGKNFRSTHQYFVIKADTRESLNAAFGLLQTETAQSTYMFQSCTFLQDQKDIMNMIKPLYEGSSPLRFNQKRSSLQRAQERVPQAVTSGATRAVG